MHRKKTRNDFSLLVGEVLKVCWEDTSGIDEGSIKEADVPVFFDTYGLCMSESEKSLILCSMKPTDDKEKVLRNLTRIPKRVIDKIDILEVTEK